VAVLEAQAGRLHEPQEALVHQRGRAQAIAAAAQPRVREAAQLRVEVAEHLVERGAVAGGCAAQQLRDRGVGSDHGVGEGGLRD